MTIETIPGVSETPITLAHYAKVTNRSLRAVQRDVKAGRIPAWKDPTMPRVKVTSLAAIARVSAAAANKAEKAFMQKAKLS